MNTNNCAANTPTCSFSVAGGSRIIVQTCGVPNSGNTALRLKASNGEILAANDDGGGDCGQQSLIQYTIPGEYYDGSVFTVAEGCHGNEQCSSTVRILNLGAASPPPSPPPKPPPPKPPSPPSNPMSNSYAYQYAMSKGWIPSPPPPSPWAWPVARVGLGYSARTIAGDRLVAFDPALTANTISINDAYGPYELATNCPKPYAWTNRRRRLLGQLLEIAGSYLGKQAVDNTYSSSGILGGQKTGDGKIIGYTGEICPGPFFFRMSYAVSLGQSVSCSQWNAREFYCTEMAYAGPTFSPNDPNDVNPIWFSPSNYLGAGSWDQTAAWTSITIPPNMVLLAGGLIQGSSCTATHFLGILDDNGNLKVVDAQARTGTPFRTNNGQVQNSCPFVSYKNVKNTPYTVILAAGCVNQNAGYLFHSPWQKPDAAKSNLVPNEPGNYMVSQNDFMHCDAYIAYTFATPAEADTISKQDGMKNAPQTSTFKGPW